jgi:hypothetical protein
MADDGDKTLTIKVTDNVCHHFLNFFIAL